MSRADLVVAASWMYPIYGAILLGGASLYHAIGRTLPDRKTLIMWFAVPPTVWLASCSLSERSLALLNVLGEPAGLGLVGVALYLVSGYVTGERTQRLRSAWPFGAMVVLAVLVGALAPTLGESP